MLKRFATTFLVLVLVGASAVADAKMGGVARQISMGGASALGIAINPFIFEDPAYQYVNPAYQGLYKDYGWSNIGGGTLAGLSTSSNGYGMQHGGINFSLGQGWALGTILAYDPSALNGLISGVTSLSGNLSGQFVSPAEVLEVVGSYGWDHSHIGLSVLYGWTNADQTTSAGKSELSGNVIGFRGGIHQDVGSGNAWEASAAFRSNSADDKSPTESADGSVTEFTVAVRGKIKVNNKVNFVPVAAFATASGDATAPTGTADLSVTAFAIGVGGELNYSDLYLAGGLSFARAESELTTTFTGGTAATTTNTVSAFPALNLGGEWWFTDWLAGRAGYVRAFTNFKTETPGAVAPLPTETNFFTGWSQISVGGYSDDNLVVLGLAARFGNFSLETTVSEEALRRGFGLAGAQDNINSFGYLTGTWNFE